MNGLNCKSLNYYDDGSSLEFVSHIPTSEEYDSLDDCFFIKDGEERMAIPRLELLKVLNFITGDTEKFKWFEVYTGSSSVTTMIKTDDEVYLSWESTIEPAKFSINCYWKETSVSQLVYELSLALSMTTNFDLVKPIINPTGHLLRIDLSDGDDTIGVSLIEFAVIKEFIETTEGPQSARYQDEGKATLERTHDGSIWLYDGDHLSDDECNICVWYRYDFEGEEKHEVDELLEQMNYIARIFNITKSGAIRDGN